MALQRARSAEEYADWVKQARFEVQDLRNCLLYDMEDIGERGVFPAFLDLLEQGVSQVYEAMCNGEYSFGREDLPFSEVAEANADQIPFVILLRQINETHRKGLDVGEES
ncbi:MAG: general secretion pathway protein GspF [Gammaproteobacteria bacterium]|nr:general secretion pathway protein GspF [Gammaproteobacteria bacterium]MCP5406946.1 general secretion pathway protein GspF [Chromatiaceae bacterium]MCP5408528.1 general secretion pathway protein GspF [Chromatiaceae bacterium]MCP5444840.1 general secretion pathway protein GspF [Chromatiaceae bacterium]